MVLNDRCISAAALVDGHALSFSDQPYFKSLIDGLRKPERPLVVIAGAGISMSAGLPSWHELVRRIESNVIPEHLRHAFNVLNLDDLERRTDIVLFLTGDNSLNAKNVKHLKTALYEDMNEPDPGMVAQGIAHLASVFPKRISIVTTNFDENLESAMTEVFDAPTSYSFESWDEWRHLSDDEHRASIMHLHGLVYPDDRASLNPLVLSESDFRKYGPDIQRGLAGLMDEADVLVLGASLADRNVATPLAVTKKSTNRRHVVATPTLVKEGLSALECSNVAVWQANSLRTALGVKPILLKSFAQVAQLVTECALASHSPSNYCRPRSGVKTADSLHYGTRFKVALDSAYQTLGSTHRDGTLSDWTALALSNRLHELTFQRGGPGGRIEELRKNHKGECASDENIGLFLWMREPFGGTDQFALRLVVTSAYAHWKSWSARRVEPILANSNNAAVQAAYSGRTLFLDVPRERHSGSWQGAWAQPLLVGYTSSTAESEGFPLDVLQLGAVAVNTNRKVTPDASGVSDLSVLAVLNADEMSYFRDAVDRTVEALFE